MLLARQELTIEATRDARPRRGAGRRARPARRAWWTGSSGLAREGPRARAGRVAGRVPRRHPAGRAAASRRPIAPGFLGRALELLWGPWRLDVRVTYASPADLGHGLVLASGAVPQRMESPCPRQSSSPPPAPPSAARQQGLAEGPAARRPRRDHRPGRARQGARAGPDHASRTSTSAAACPAASPGYNMARIVSDAARAWTTCPGATITRYCSSSLQTTRMAFHAIKAGEGDVFISAGVEMVSPVRQGHLRRTGPTPRTRSSPTPRRAPKATAARRRQRPRLARPPRGRRTARRLHRDGPDRRERRPARAASPARSMDEFGVRSQNLAEKAIADGFWEREITPVDPARRHRGQHRTTAPAPASPRGGWPA